MSNETTGCIHTCNCGTSDHVPHLIGEDGCIRRMAEAPTPGKHAGWIVDGFQISDFTLRQQRGYHQHACGCWSWAGTSVNSIGDEL